MTQPVPDPYLLDPDDPRAPTSAQWAIMSEVERRRVVDALPTSLPIEVHPPEGDVHRKVKQRAVTTLDDYFQRARRKLYISSELTVFYPGERPFVPDVFAVLDVEPHDRVRWVVDVEKRGVDFVLEILVAGSRSKDLRHNVDRFARLGIQEYFVFDKGAERLHAHRLAAGGRYERIVPQHGLYTSRVLELDLGGGPGGVRFFANNAALEGLEERVARLGSMVDGAMDRAEQAAARAEQEAARAEQEAARAEQEAARAEQEAARASAAERSRAEAEERAERAEARLAEALAELDRLKRS